MDVNIDVSEEALEAFLQTVTSFSTAIENSCSTLRSALELFLQSVDEQTVQTIESVVNEILALLAVGEQDLTALRTNVERYKGLIARLRFLALSVNGGGAYNDSSRAVNEGSVEGNGLHRTSSALPRSLAQTQYGFEPLTFQGQTVMMYNSPLETAKGLIQKQGRNSKGMGGTCGLCQCANLLRLAGVTDVGEDDVIDTALSCSQATRDDLTVWEADPDDRGGSSAWGRSEILGRYSLDTEIYGIPNDTSIAISHFSQKISSGHGVIVSVDAGVLWNEKKHLGSGHAILLLSVSQSGKTFVYSDTGANRIGLISASRLQSCLTGRPANITTNIIR